MKKETHATVLVVSHDTNFLDAVCTDIIHYENLKLVRYPGNLTNFVEKKPECRSYYELASTGGLSFKFPNPGRLEGINSTSRKIAYMDHVDFAYPGKKELQLRDVSCSLCLGSRVCILGANGAGKTTLVKLLVGEMLPSNPDVGEVWKHHNLRISYVAQHSFHHVEAHLDKSPVEYIQWRFKNAEDQESLSKDVMKIDEEAAARLGQRYGQIEKLTGARHTKGGKLEYEVKFQGMREKDNKFLTRDDLEDLGFGPLCRQIDEKVAAEAAGIDLRSNTSSEIQTHLDDFNLHKEFGTYGRIKGLSGGQKVKLVLAAAFWTVPHLLVLDEPTNYLDREALGALAEAIKDFGGGVIMISHNKEFYGALCTEEWDLADGRLKVKGQVEEKDLKLSRKRTEKEILMEATETVVAEKGGGSINDVKQLQTLTNEKTGRPLSKKEIRALAKEAKKNGKK
jgi:elongation factor 3